MAIDVGRVVDLGGQDIMCRTLFTGITTTGNQSLSGTVSSAGGSGGALADTETFIILQGDSTGTAWGNAATTNIFGMGGASGVTTGAVNIAGVGGGQFAFEGQYYISNANSGTATNYQTVFGGSANIASISYMANGNNTSGATAMQAGGLTGFSNTVAATVVTPSFNSAGATGIACIYLSGVISVTVGSGGLLIPQIKTSGNMAAAAGNQTVKAGSFFRIWSLGATSTPFVGNWS